MKIRPGFTLIELLVTSAIIMILAGSGLAAYNNFNDKQTLDAAAAELKNNLRMARSWAMTVKKVACTTDVSGGYKVNFDVSDGDYGIKEMCGSNEVGSWQNFSYPQGVSDDYNGNFIFKPLTGETGVDAITIALTLKLLEPKKVTIKTNGEIE